MSQSIQNLNNALGALQGTQTSLGDQYQSWGNNPWGAISGVSAQQIGVQQTFANQAYQQQLWRLTSADVLSLIGNMTWTCTNPSCGKPLQIGKRAKSGYAPVGVVVLECSRCGFEFMAKAEVSAKDVKKPSTKLELEIAVLKKKVKDFELA